MFPMFVLQPYGPEDIGQYLVEVNACVVPGRQLRCADYAFKLPINPRQHPRFAKGIHHLMTMIVSLSNRCGGVVFLTRQDWDAEADDTSLETFKSRLLGLVGTKLQIPFDLITLIPTSQSLGNDRAWGAISVAISEKKLNYAFPFEGPVTYFIDHHGYVFCAKAPMDGCGQEKLSIAKGSATAESETETATASRSQYNSASVNNIPKDQENYRQNYDEDDIRGGLDPRVDFSLYKRLDWAEHKKDWEKYVEARKPSTDDIVKTCAIWEPASPMRVTPDIGTLGCMFESEQHMKETLSMIETPEPAFAIACRTWRFRLPDDQVELRLPGHICDILTVSQSNNINLWVVFKDTDESMFSKHLEYMILTGRSLKFQLASKATSGLPNIFIRCQLLSACMMTDNCHKILEEFQKMQNKRSQVCPNTGKFETLQRAIASMLLSKESSLKRCIGDQVSVTLSKEQSKLLMKDVQVNYVMGPAGSGKSLVAMSLYRMNGPGQSVYICTTEPFLEYLRYNGCVGTLVKCDHDLCWEIEKGAFNNTNCVIIDDSHNLNCTMKSLEELFKVLHKNRYMTLFVFADNEYQSFDRKRQQTVYDCIHNLTRQVLNQIPAVEYLTEIYRNTKKVVSFVQSSIQDARPSSRKITCANPVAGDGVECLAIKNVWLSADGNELVLYLRSMMCYGRYQPNEVAVLLDTTYTRDQILRCKDILEKEMQEVRFQCASTFPRTGIIVDTVESFLGLDASLCVFILPTQSFSKQQRSGDNEYGPTLDNPHYRVYLASRATNKAVFVVPNIDANTVLQMKFDKFQVCIWTFRRHVFGTLVCKAEA